MDILGDLNEPQREAVTHVDGPLLVLAGAGSGKTRVITRRVAYLVSEGIDPRSILAITFTNKAAEEMRQRVTALRTPPGATVCTFHSLCARLLRDYAHLAGIRAGYSIYDRNDQLKVAKQAIEELNLKGSYLTPGKAHAAISNAKNDLRTPQAYAELAGDFFSRNVSEIYTRYEQIMAANCALDFDDLLMRMAFLLRDRPEVRVQLGERYRYVLIDEYQDTNHAQYIIAHGIAMDHENICATGDPDQSIYAWRGADISNILDFEKDYPGAKVIRLEENYRSVQPILSGASRLIAHNTMRKSKGLFTRKPGGEDVRVLLVDDEQAEAREVADRIERHRIDGGSYGDVAIFYRVNSLSRVLEEALMRKGIAYRIARGVEFYNRAEIRDMLAYARLLLNPADDVSCARIINTPTRGIGATTIKRLGDYAMKNNLSLLAAARAVEASHLPAAAQKRVRAFADLIDSLAAEIGRPVRMVLEDIFHRSGLEEALSSADEEARQARANIEELITSAAEFDHDHEDATLEDYLQQISLVSDIDHFEGDEGSVTLMTLHAAKGLEFPAVFIVGCEEGLLPFQREAALPGEGEDIQALEEERRLAFVGMTRAKEKLTLSSARSRMVRGRRMPQAASRFLHEMGEDDARQIDLTTGKHDIGRRRRKSRGGFYDASEREAIEEFAGSYDPFEHYEVEQEPIPPEYEYLRPGCMVRHPKFGVGKLLKLSQPWPDTRAEVHFHQFGKKKLVLAMSKLEMAE